MTHDPKDSAKAIDAFAFRVMRRLIAAGDRSLTLDDIKQELWIAWCLATESYDPGCGVPFLACLRNGMRLHINRYVEKHVDRRHSEVTALSLDAPGNDDDGGSFADVVPSADPAPDEAVIMRSQLDYVMKNLSPRAKIFVTLLRDQPVELLKEVRKIEEKAIYARDIGKTMPFTNRLTAALVFTLMDASRVERLQITKEVRTLGDLVCEMDI